ncbi:amino acid transporter [Cryphonectria parasitica EP155]|uniref:Amino acid transporter n=1 Tax=Cryphonectria parasitica (strain ATCC 38755 / EP155) TaxID=660469 RepID=A0A9P5CNQ7_CRYP1|nr:amino acid transporter [Cryphonectria parasitica EP155]KAF3764180.1 amino acid transporter [Cryphonectria parasitica EP155]
MAFWRRPFSQREQAPDNVGDDQSEVTDGTLYYVVEKAGNDSGPTYQEASGAPVEIESPLGYDVGSITIIFLNISMMIGTGVYSTPSTILKDTGSVGLSMIYWFIGLIMSVASFAVYLEFASYFSNRSGSEVVYLEQAYPRPRWLFPTAFAFQTVILSFSSGNSIVLAEYLFATSGHDYTGWQLKGVAVAGYTVAFILVALHTRFSYWFSNAVGIIKVLTLVFISITGLVVLGGHTRVEDPLVNFRDSFNQDPATTYGLTNALYKIAFSYAGYTNAFNVVNEVKNPVKQIQKNGYISLAVVGALYILANIAYFAAVPREDLAAAEQIAASLFFTNVFGSSGAVRGLNFLIALSSFGNLLAVLLGQSRVLRECGRQGVLPWPRFWASTKPFGTPLGPYFVKWLLTIVMILAPPAGDAFNFISDLQVYPAAFFSLLLAIGLYLVRWRRGRLNLPRPVFRAWDACIILTILVAIFQLVMPWYPPTGGPYAGDVSFWYATYVVTGIALIIACAVYYWAWISLVPRIRGYRIRQEIIELDGGATSHVLTKIPVSELAQWDETHDATGRQRYSSGSTESVEGGVLVESGEKGSV